MHIPALAKGITTGLMFNRFQQISTRFQISTTIGFRRLGPSLGFGGQWLHGLSWVLAPWLECQELSAPRHATSFLTNSRLAVDAVFDFGDDPNAASQMQELISRDPRISHYELMSMILMLSLMFIVLFNLFRQSPITAPCCAEPELGHFMVLCHGRWAVM